MPNENHAVVIPSDAQGLEPTKAEQIKNAFMPMLEAMDALAKEAESVKALEMSEEAAEKAKDLRLRFVKVRTSCAAIHKAEKAVYLLAGRVVDGWKNAQLMAGEKFESELKAIETHYEDIERERIEALTAEREALVSQYAETVPPGLGHMDADVFGHFVEGIKRAADERKAAEEKAEAERVAAEKAEAERIEAQRVENERLKVEAAEAAKREAEIQALRKKEYEAAEKKAKLEREAAAKKLEAERKKAEAERSRIEAEHEAERAAEKKRLGIAEAKAKRERKKAEAKIQAERKAAEKAKADYERLMAEADERSRKLEAEEAKKAKLAANKKHRAEVDLAALEAFVLKCFIGTETARDIVDEIKAGEIPGVSINY